MSQQERESVIESLGEAVQRTRKSIVEMGAPFAGSKTMSSLGVQDGKGGFAPNGYSIFQADDPDAAAKLVKDCPDISEGGEAAHLRAGSDAV